MTNCFSDFSPSDWFGLTTLILAVFATYLASSFGANKAGKQRIAQARLDWNNSFQSLSCELYENIEEIDRLDKIGRYPIRRRRISDRTKKIAAELLMMVNPDSGTHGSIEEYEMETYLTSKLSSIGIEMNLDHIRTFRRVLKASWQTAKQEF